MNGDGIPDRLTDGDYGDDTDSISDTYDVEGSGYFSPKHKIFNPYRQIPKTISKKRAVTQGISRKLFPDFAISGRDSGDFPETILGRIQVNLMSTYP